MSKYVDIKGTTHTSFKIGNSATPGQVLTTDAEGIGTWQDAEGGVGSTVNLYTLEFTNADLVAGILSVEHGLGFKIMPVVVADNANAIILPDDVVFVDEDNLTIDLTGYGSIAGTWTVACGCGGGSAPAIYWQILPDEVVNVAARTQYAIFYKLELAGTISLAAGAELIIHT
jgi:hypothetical protein